MTDSLECENPPDALTTRSTAADWLIARRMSEGWTEDDQASLDRWLAQSPANRVAYWRLEGAWGHAKRLTALRQPMRQSGAPSSVRTRALRLASVFGAAIGLGVFGFQFLGNSDLKTYTTPVGGRLTIALADGSKIELNTDSILRVSTHASIRQATLEKGEAYFQIEHDASHPFVVKAGDQRVTDLGTKFSVRKESGKVLVSLYQGSARVEPQKNNAIGARILSPGDVAVATAESITVMKTPVLQLNERLAWRRGMIEFKRATLAEAATEFNRYNRTKIVIADPRAARLTIHGTFEANDVSAFVDAAQAYFNLRTEKRGDAVAISR